MINMKEGESNEPKCYWKEERRDLPLRGTGSKDQLVDGIFFSSEVSTMVTTGEIRTIVGIMGNVISLFLFLSPLPTFIKICKVKSVEEFKPDPYVATISNCVMWVFYCLPIVHSGAILLLSTNAVGLVIETTYVIVFIIYSDWPKRRKIFIFLLLEAIFFGIIVAVTLGFLHDTKERAMLVGIICIGLNVGMYFSPLTVVRRVIKTKSVKYMPFSLSLANFASAGIWTAYGVLKFDVNIFAPNCLGILSGVIQLVLYAMYYRTTKWDEEEKPHLGLNSLGETKNQKS